MIKLNASLSKKVPIEGIDYSSQSFMAGLEVEISDNSDSLQVKQRIREVYQLLDDSINEQIEFHQSDANKMDYLNEKSCSLGQHNKNNYSRNKHRNNNRPASQAQLKAIEAIAADRGLSGSELSAMLLDNLGKSSAAELSLRDASQFITFLNDA